MDSTLFSEMNWLAVLVAAVAYWLLGAIWYSALFSKQWVAYQKIDVNDPNLKKGTGAIMFASLILMFVVSIGIAILMSRLALEGGWMSGAKLGLLTGLCFSATAISITYLYLKRPMGLHLIDGLYHVVGQVIVGVILSVWP